MDQKFLLWQWPQLATQQRLNGTAAEKKLTNPPSRQASDHVDYGNSQWSVGVASGWSREYEGGSNVMNETEKRLSPFFSNNTGPSSMTQMGEWNVPDEPIEVGANLFVAVSALQLTVVHCRVGWIA